MGVILCLCKHDYHVTFSELGDYINTCILFFPLKLFFILVKYT